MMPAQRFLKILSITSFIIVTGFLTDTEITHAGFKNGSFNYTGLHPVFSLLIIFFLILQCSFFIFLILRIRVKKNRPDAFLNPLNSATDLTKKKLTNLSGNGYEKRFEDVLDALTDGYIEVNLHGTIINLNKSVARTFNCTREELKGQNYSTLLSIAENDTIASTYKRIFQTGTPEKIRNIRFTGTDNIKKLIDVCASLIVNDTGDIVGYRAIVRDVTELNLAKDNQSRLRAQLQRSQQIEAIGTLAGGIAHDFNNLLMAIQGNTSILLFKMDKQNPLYSKLINIENCIHSGAELTKQLLGFAKGRNASIEILCINDLAKETANTFKRTKKAIHLLEKYNDELPPIEADSNQIKQVILNLFINTWQASPSKKDLFIKTSQKELDVNLARNIGVRPGGYVVILISNFDTSQHSDDTQEVLGDFKTGINAGIGITSTSEVVKSYNGIIEFQHYGYDKSAYVVYLPASEEKQPKVEPPLPVQQNGTGTVLFVDDEEMIIEVGKPMLEELGYDVLVARGGEEAIKVYEVNRGKIDLVILDLVMPRIDGGDVYNVLKKIDPNVRTLLSSGYSLDEKADILLNKGCNGFIQKPFNLKRLSEQIRLAMTEGRN